MGSVRFAAPQCKRNLSNRISGRVRGELIVVEDVPAGVCPRCGEKVVKADVGRLIIKLIENPERIAKSPRISVPAIKFNAEEAKV
jgi:YgiT-type zinc finger domain-containing protein